MLIHGRRLWGTEVEKILIQGVCVRWRVPGRWFVCAWRRPSTLLFRRFIPRIERGASCGLTGWNACRDCKRSSLWTSRTAYRSALIGSLFFTLRIFVRPLLFDLSPPFHPCNIGISLPFHFCLIDFSRLLFGELCGGVLCHFLRCKIDSVVRKLST